MRKERAASEFSSYPTDSHHAVTLPQGADGEIERLKSQFRERSSGTCASNGGSDRAPFPARVLAAMLDVARELLAREVESAAAEVSGVVRLGSYDSTIVAIE